MAQGTTKRELREALAALEASCENSNLRCPGCGATHIPYQECSYCLSRMRARAILERPARMVGYVWHGKYGESLRWYFVGGPRTSPREKAVPDMATARRLAYEMVTIGSGGTVKKLVVYR